MARQKDSSRGPPDAPEPSRPWPADLRAALGLLGLCLDFVLDLYYSCQPKRTPGEAVRKITYLQDAVRAARPIFDEIGVELRRAVSVERVTFQGKRCADAFDAGLSFAEDVLIEI